MVKHQPLQVYERQLCLSCLTGIYGCRWKRYQRSHDDSSKWECSWFLILFSLFLLLLVWSYFWWVAHNDYNEFNWLLYNRSGEWSDGTVPILATTLVGFSYTAFLMILGLCHVTLGQQLNLYWIHKIGVLVVLLTTITGVVSIDDIWRDEWDIILISLQSTGPFLHIGAVAAMTALGWIIAGQVMRVERTRFQVLLLLLYLCVLLALYLSPLTLSSPCIMDQSNLKPRPTIIGRRGAPMLAPENTIMSFNKALQQRVSGFETDVTIRNWSFWAPEWRINKLRDDQPGYCRFENRMMLQPFNARRLGEQNGRILTGGRDDIHSSPCHSNADGVAFLMRDRTLRRTTDIGQVFPQRQHEDASLFTWSEIRSLNAGLWFLRDDPYWTTQLMTVKERRRAANQTVCSLVELLRLAVKTNRSVMFSLRRPPAQHPRYELWISDVLKAVQRSGIQSEQVMWMTDWYRKKVRSNVPLLEQTEEQKLSAEEFKERGLRTVSIHYSQATEPEIWRFRGNNVSVNVYPVNEPWLYSVLWCSGVQSVSSEAPHILRKVPQPIWFMSPDEYCLIWIMADLISAAIIIGIFILQSYHFIRLRMSGMRSYNPEQIMLSAVVRQPSRDVNIMKEKLIFSEINNGVSNTDELPLYTEHGYEGYTRDTISR